MPRRLSPISKRLASRQAHAKSSEPRRHEQQGDRPFDANVLIRAVLGRRVQDLVFAHAAMVKFFAPDVAYADARKYLPALLAKRGLESDAAMKVLDGLESIVQPIALRDADDWPVLACAMVIGCLVWTEDADFFGTGVPTWTTDRVELYFAP